MRTEDDSFIEPAWSAPLDAAAALRKIPEDASVAGMFLAPLSEGAKKLGTVLPSARDRYLPFQFYPMREHAKLMVEAAAVLFPKVPLRTALRKFGKLAPRSMLESTIGRVVLGSASNVEQTLAAMVRTYPLHIRPSQAELTRFTPGRAIVRLTDVYYFLDSHHVGAFEGAMYFAGKRQTHVRIRVASTSAADFLIAWET
ncbi:MAG: DUF2378 family protein [Polyangiales bacterium]